MSKLALLFGSVSLLALQASCVSSSMVGYGDGWVKTSQVSYSFDGPPLLSSVQGHSYHVAIDGMNVDAPLEVSAFDEQGMAWSDDARNADVSVHVEVGDVHQGDPGAMKLGKKWYPAFEVSVPYEITVQSDGQSLDHWTGSYSNHLTFKQAQGFESREQAVGALATIRQLAQDGVEEQARTGAYSEVKKSANDMGRGLFRERTISMAVPVVRSAAGLDLEHAYELLVTAESPDQVRDALSAYERLGTSQRKEDGTQNNTANYGVACGIASCKLLLRDLPGAWDSCQLASTFEPRGEEADQIRRVIYEQERITGVRVLPEEERAKIDSAMDVAEKFQGLINAFSD